MNKVSKVDLEYFERRFRSEPYIIINRLYTEEVLDKVKGNLKISEGLWQTVQMVGKLVDLGDFSYNERLELIFYAVMTNDEADILFLKSNPQLCDKCGWCCKNCYPIEVTEADIERAGGFRNLEPIKTEVGEMFSLKIPCELLTDHNRCSIYGVRPRSCGSYPLGINEGKNIVQRNPNCGYITNLLLNKVEGWAKRIREIRGEK